MAPRLIIHAHRGITFTSEVNKEVLNDCTCGFTFATALTQYNNLSQDL